MKHSYEKTLHLMTRDESVVSLGLSLPSRSPRLAASACNGFVLEGGTRATLHSNTGPAFDMTAHGGGDVALYLKAVRPLHRVGS